MKGKGASPQTTMPAVEGSNPPGIIYQPCRRGMGRGMTDLHTLDAATVQAVSPRRFTVEDLPEIRLAGGGEEGQA